MKSWLPALAILLTGCADNQWRGAEDALHQCLTATCEQDQAKRRAEQLAANDDAVCRGYGAARGTRAYIQCRMNQDNQRVNEDTTQRALITQHLLNRSR